VEAKDVVFKCGPNCSCGPSCVNRVFQLLMRISSLLSMTMDMVWLRKDLRGMMLLVQFCPSIIGRPRHTGIMVGMG